MYLFYNSIIKLYGLIIRITAPFNSKAKLFITGRKNIFERIKLALSQNKNIVWFHCSSLGEFEQARPLIENYKKKYFDHNILLTFFSPSGYEIIKEDTIADWVFYLPIDTKQNAKKFISIVQPIKVIFIKYEFWFNYMRECSKRGVPFYSISAVFRKEQIFFKNIWFRKQLRNITYFFVQDKISFNLLKDAGFNNIQISGDTKFDSVIKTRKESISHPLINNFSKNKNTIICGSTWPKDEEIIIKMINENQLFNYIIAPHEMNHLEKLKTKTNGIFLSELDNSNVNKYNVLIIDKIGILKTIYKYGDIAYIGGGFGKGIHNILEAATFGLPILFGPNYKKFNEAHELLERGIAKKIHNYKELVTAANSFINFEKSYAIEYIDSKCGATKIILDNL